MKKKHILMVIALAAINFLLFPAAARAGFFNDGRWYMDSSMWQEWTVWDTENRTALVDSDNRLNITTSGGYPSGWADGYEASRYYGSKWTFDLNHDFEFTLSFITTTRELFLAMKVA